MNAFVILSGITVADVLDKKIQLEETSWTGKDGKKHTVGAIRVGNNLVRQTKDGRTIIQAAPKQPKKR